MSHIKQNEKEKKMVAKSQYTSLKGKVVRTDEGLLVQQKSAGWMKAIEYLFHFKGGGWNTVYAGDLEQAKELVDYLYGERGVIYASDGVLLDTVKPVKGNEHEYTMLLTDFD
jgi:hypothetical protein